MKISEKVYVSTGGLKNINATQAIKKFRLGGISEMELSGGKFQKNIEKKIINLSNKHNLRIHNYFPTPKEPFVINLASSNKKILKKSINHAKKAINLASKMKSKYYSFHAGFLIDPSPKLLGKQFNIIEITDRNEALKIFKKSVILINNFARKKDVTIFIENNVITKKNIKTFNTNPLLLTNPKEILIFFKKIPKNIKLLLDVAHLKVSAKTEGFSISSSFKKLNKLTGGYHLSDNNGLVDSNESFSPKAWFFKYIKKNLEYYTIEVYRRSILDLKKQKMIVENFLRK